MMNVFFYHYNPEQINTIDSNDFFVDAVKVSFKNPVECITVRYPCINPTYHHEQDVTQS